MRLTSNPNGILDLPALTSNRNSEGHVCRSVNAVAVPIGDPITTCAVEIVQEALAYATVLAVGEGEGVIGGGGWDDVVLSAGACAGDCLASFEDWVACAEEGQEEGGEIGRVMHGDDLEG